MPILRRILRSAVLVSALLVISLSSANAQLPPDYLFLEVLDSAGKPVPEAKVQLSGYVWENNQKKESWRDGQPTDANGKSRTEWYFSYSSFTNSLFRVIKPEYFPFYDLGTPKSRNLTSAKIELLKIPTTRAERQMLGNEQIKREFMLAVRNGELERVRQFIKSGIDPNLNTDDLRGIAGPKNIPAIIFAAAAGNNEMIELFLKSKVSLQTNAEPIRSILYYYLLSDRFYPDRAKSDEKLKRQYEDGVKMLVKAGAEIKKLPPDETNALMLAVRTGHINLVKFFLAQGLPINARDKNGETALFYANYFQDLEMFEFLLNAGADPNMVSKPNTENCRTVLMNAVWGGNVKIIKALLASKAEVNFTCSNGHNALWMAQERKRYGYPADEVINVLTEAGAK